jgi:hypothetical protein
MTGTWWRRPFLQRRPASANRRPARGVRPRLEVLEDRLTPTTNLVISFGGTTLTPGNAKGYLIPASGRELGTPGSFEQFIPTNPTTLGFAFTAFKGYAAPGEAQATPAERLAQIQYILAGVRQDYAPFDVNVIWDDRGPNSPFFRAGTGDTLAVVTDNQDSDVVPGGGLFGISSSVDGDTLERVSLNGATSGTFQLKFGNQTTTPLPFNATPAQVQAALVALTNIGQNVTGGNAAGVGPQPNVNVGQDVRNGDFLVEFTESLGHKDQPLLSIASTSLRTGTAPSNPTTSFIYHGGGNNRLDTAVIFAPTSAVPPLGLPATGNRQMRELIDTISHEGGHTFGLSHDFVQDPEQRQMTASVAGANNGANNTFLDSRFSPFVLIHGPPESGALYSEIQRLDTTGYLGPSPTTPYGAQFPDFQSSQNLPPPPEPGNPDVPTAFAVQTTLAAGNTATVTGTLVYVGDRIAYEFQVPFTSAPNVPILVRMSPTPGSTLTPALTLWDSGGNFLANGTRQGTDSFAFLRVNPGETFFVDAGSLVEQQETAGGVPLPVSGAAVGGFRITVAPGFLPPTTPVTPTPLINPGLIVVGADAGQAPEVRVFDRAGNNVASFMAYDPSFTGGVRVAVGDVNNDGLLDIVTGPGPGGGPDVEVWFGAADGTFTLGNAFFAYDPSFTGGVNVAVGDLNGDGFADIITGAGPGGGPHVRATSGQLLVKFGVLDFGLFDNFVYSPAFRGGVSVAAGDLYGGGFDAMITGAGPGGGPHVEVWSFNPTIGANAAPAFNGQIGFVDGFFAYDPSFTGGVFVASGDVNGDGYDDIVTGAGQGGGPNVKSFDGSQIFKYVFQPLNQTAPGGGQFVSQTILLQGPGIVDGNTPLSSFFAYDVSDTTGVHVALVDLNGDGRKDYVTGPASVFDSFTQPAQGLGGNPPNNGSFPFTFPINEPNTMLSEGGLPVQPSGLFQAQPGLSLITGAAPGLNPGLHLIDALTLAQLPTFDTGLPNGIWVGGE